MKITLPILLTVLLISTSSILFGQSITINTAKEIAINHLLSVGKASLKSASPNKPKFQFSSVSSAINNKDTLYFVLNDTINEGFVIVAADKRVWPILGYSLEGKFDETNQPPAFTEWMEQRKQEIAYIKNNNLPADSRTTQQWDNLSSSNSISAEASTTSVAPLLTTTWNQSQYYNDKCPADNNSPYGYNGHVPTGCTATAMAQVMKFWNYPNTGTGSKTYTPFDHPEYGSLTANFGAATYLWDQMQNKVTSQNDAVAILMFHCGVSVDMNYGPNESGAGQPRNALVNYFKYSSDALYIEKNNYTTSDWVNLLRFELDSKRPIWYDGFNYSYTSGHAFVCDGYQNTDYFHFNWGWGGSADNYFYLGSLNPGGRNYSSYQGAVIKVFPKNTPDPIGSITGLTEVCQGQTSVTYSVPAIQNAASFVWTLPTGATGTSTTNSINVNFGSNAQSGAIKVKGRNSLGYTSESTLAINVNATPAAPGLISGNKMVCPGVSETYTISPISGATSYVWQLPTGWTGSSTSNSITVVTGSTGGTITVRGNSSSCPGPVSSLVVTMGVPVSPTSATATKTSIVIGQSTTLSIVGGTLNSAPNWIWYTVSCGGTPAGNGSTLLVSPTTTTTYYVQATGCGVSTTCKSVKIIVCPDLTPGAITGNSMVCPNVSETYSIPPISGATSYVWQLPTGWTGSSTSNSISVLPGTSNGTITVKAITTECTGATSSLTVKSGIPVSPSYATATQTTILEGQSTTLSVVGGTLNFAPNWVWYTGSCGGTPAGTGSTLLVTPATTTTYYVQAIGCGVTTTCKSITINVCSTPPSPNSSFASIGSPANGTSHKLSFGVDIVSEADGYSWDYSWDGINWQINWLQKNWTSVTWDLLDKPNYPVYFRVRSYKCSPLQYSNYTYTTPQPIYTACDEPATPTVNGATNTSLSVTLNSETPVANPNYTKYSIYCVTASKFVQADGTLNDTEVFQTKSEWGTKIVSGLSSGLQYCFYAKARNGNEDIRFNTSNSSCGTTLNGSITANFSTTTTSGCSPMTVNFNDESIGTPISWAWDVDNNGTVDYTTKTPTHTYSIAGTYSVKLTVNNTLGSDTKTRTNYITVNSTVLPGVVISASPSTTITSGQLLTFTANPTNGGTNPTYEWKINGSTVGLNSPTFTSSNLTSGQVVTCVMTSTLTCVSPITATSNPLTITVTQANRVPVANAGVDRSVIERSLVTLDGTASSDPDNNSLTYSWSAPMGITLSSTTASKPTFTAPEVSFNTNYTFYLIVNDGTANSIADQVVITVNPISDVIATPARQTICSGTATSIALSSNITGTTYSWTVVQSGVSGASSGSGSTIAQTLTTTGTVAGTATYTITPTANGFPGTPISVIITINQNPTVNVIGAKTYCAGIAAAAIPLTGTPIGVIFDISGGTSIGLSNQTGVTYIPSYYPIAGTATITIIPRANGCIGTPITYNITVSSVPGVTATPDMQTIQSGTATSILLSSSTPGATFTWSVIQSGVSGASSGTGSTIAQTLTTTGTTSGTATYTVTPNSNGCSGTSKTVVITVTKENKAPVANAGSDQSVNSGVPVTLDGTASSDSNNHELTYLWTAPAGITLSSDTASRPRFTAPEVSAITNYTFSLIVSNGTLTSIADQVTISVNPISDVKATPAQQTICSGTASSIALSSNVPGTTFSWTVVQSGVSGASSGSGSTIAQTLIATGTTSGTATYKITPTANGANGVSISVAVTVNPLPTLNTPAEPTYCSSVLTTAIPLAGSPSGVIFDITGGGSIGLADQIGATSIPSFTTISGTATVMISPKANGCTGISKIFKITVIPTPTAISPGNQTYCQSILAPAIPLTGIPSGVTFDITGGSSVGLADQTGVTTIPSFTTFAGTATITITPKSNGCSGTPVQYTITVNPTPTVTQPDNQNLCFSRTTTAINFTGTGTSYTWTNNTPGIGLASNGTGNIASFAAINTGTSNIMATITVTPVYTGGGIDCYGSAKTFTITVSPITELVITDPLPVAFPSTIDLTLPAVTSGSKLPNGTILSYWTDQTVTIPLANPSAVANSGTYFIKATNATTGCSILKSINVTINQSINLIITNPFVVCNPLTVDLTAPYITSGSDSGLSYTYWMDASASILLVNPTAVSISGTFYIKATKSTTGYFIIKPVTVNINPVTNLVVTNPAAVCYPNSVDLTSASITVGSDSGLNYTYWTNAAANTLLATPFATATSGTYYIKATSAITGCTVTKPVNVVINPQSKLVVTNPNPVCSSATVDLTALSLTTGSDMGLKFTYWTDDVATIELTAPSAVSKSGIYFIQSESVSGCKIIRPVNVTINPSPAANAVGVQTYCAGTATTAIPLSGSPVGVVFDISGGRGIGLADQSGITSIPSYTPTAGTATITITPRANGCSGTSKTFNITVNPNPTVTITGDQTYCCGVATPSIALTSNVSGTAFVWTVVQSGISGASNGIGSTIAQRLSTTGNSSGTATYTVIPTVNGCVGTPKNVVITVNQANQTPAANAGKDQSANEGTLITLDGTASSDPDNNLLAYLWTAPAGITLSSTTASKPTFIAPEVKKDSLLNFTLIVHDGFVNSPPSSVKISVKNVIKTSAEIVVEKGLKVYPNPTNGIITIEGLALDKKTKIEVYTIDGKLIMKKTTISPTCKIDISEQISGTYLVVVNKQTIKIIKE